MNTFTSEWKQGNLQSIYYDADPQFRRISLQDWSSWKNTIDQRWGALRDVKIRRIDRVAPLVEVYRVKADVEYNRGMTKGNFTLLFGEVLHFLSELYLLTQIMREELQRRNIQTQRAVRQVTGGEIGTYFRFHH